MKALHQQSIIHGDIKSENILIKILETREVIFKLADFGCSLTVDHRKNHSEVWIGGTSSVIKNASIDVHLKTRVHDLNHLPTHSERMHISLKMEFIATNLAF